MKEKNLAERFTLKYLNHKHFDFTIHIDDGDFVVNNFNKSFSIFQNDAQSSCVKYFFLTKIVG